MEDIVIACNRVYRFFTWTIEKELDYIEQESPAAEQTIDNSTGEGTNEESEKDNNIDLKRIEKSDKIIKQLNERVEEVERTKNRIEETGEKLREKQRKMARLEEQLKNCQEVLKQAFTKLANAIVEWKELRREIINKLETVADVMEKKKTDTNIGVLSGSVVGLTGAGLTIAGAILTPLTMGIASPLLFAGLGVTGAGIAVKGGSQISDYVIGKGHTALVIEQIRLDQERNKHLLRLDEERCKSATYLSKIEQQYDTCLKDLKNKYPVEYERMQTGQERRPNMDNGTNLRIITSTFRLSTLVSTVSGITGTDVAGTVGGGTPNVAKATSKIILIATAVRDITISERAKQLRKNVKILKKETVRIEEDETIQKLIDEYYNSPKAQSTERNDDESEEPEAPAL